VENASELDDAATYFNLLDSLEDENLPIDRDTLNQRMANLYSEPDVNASGKLQVLTIYAAKGLEFDTVILPGLNRAPSTDKSKLLHWFELPGEDRIVMSPMRNQADKEKQKKSGDLIEFIANIEKQRQSFEDGRLLYVATTRARHSLYLFAAIKPTAKGEIKAGSATLLGGLWPAIQAEQTPLIRQAAEDLTAVSGNEPAEDATTISLPLDYQRLAADWLLPTPAEAVQLAGVEPGNQLADVNEYGANDYIEFSWAGEDARLTGNLVHRLLQLIGEEGLEAWQAGDGMSKCENWCHHQLMSKGIRQEKADAIVSRASRAINNCLASEQGRWILESHQDAHCEFAITAVLDGHPANMVLDRTFINEGARWIIDYKTSSHSGGDLEGFLETEAGRYREQMQRYKTAVALTESLPIRTALYFPLLDRFCEL